MRYLFFDIECCDGNHMCSFGYVIVDEKFRVIEQKDILINPETEFKLGRAGFDPVIQLAYGQDVFYKQKPFKCLYDEIKGLLLCSNQVLLGHSISADIQYLKIACERYGCQKLEICVYDTQNFYYQFNPKYPQRSLDNIVKDLDIDISNIQKHKSDNDAQISMMVTKEICRRLDVSLTELIELCESSRVDSNTINAQNKLVYSTGKKESSNIETHCTALELALKKAFIKKKPVSNSSLIV